MNECLPAFMNYEVISYTKWKDEWMNTYLVGIKWSIYPIIGERMNEWMNTYLGGIKWSIYPILNESKEERMRAIYQITACKPRFPI